MLITQKYLEFPQKRGKLQFVFFPLAFQGLVEVYVGQALEEGGDLVVEEVGALKGGQQPNGKVLEEASSCKTTFANNCFFIFWDSSYS